MGNFWNTFERHRVRNDFAEIAGDGFNTIILILPWAHFQPQVHPIGYDQGTLDRFQFVVDEARHAGLRIMLRLGYLWDNSKARVTTYQRYQRLFQAPGILEAWIDFVRRIESVVGEDAQDVVFFLSWEDPYWPVLRIPEDTPLERRIKYAKDIGLIDFMRRRFPFSLLQTIYGVKATSYEDLPAPTIGESGSLFAEFVLFFDREYIERWILTTRAALHHSLWYEHRVDPDVVPMSLDAIEHSTYKTGVACDVLYYHPKVGVRRPTPLNSKQAANHLARTLTGFRQNNIHKRPVFLDQFNFKIDNPKHPDFSRLADEHIPDFLALCEPVFRRHLVGYGIWGYRDWRDDKVFNGTFELGLKGWRVLEGDLIEKDGKYRLVLGPGASLTQEIDNPGSQPRCYLEFDPTVSPVTIEMGNGDSTTTTVITNDRTFIEVAFEGKGKGRTLEIRCVDGTLRLSKVAYFSHVFTNGMRGLDGSSSTILRAISRLNRALLAGGGKTLAMDGPNKVFRSVVEPPKTTPSAKD